MGRFTTVKWLLVVAAVMCGSAALSQTGGGFDLAWNTIDGGGATFSTGGGYTLGGTIGQPDASNPLTGGAYSLTGGFWVAPCSGPQGDTNCDGCVDDADMTNIILDFGAPPSGSNGATDVDGTGEVDDADLTIAILNFGAGC